MDLGDLMMGVGQIGASLIGAFRDRCTISAEGAPASDGAGGYTNTPSALASAVPCDYVKAKGDEKVIGDATVDIGDVVVTLNRSIEVPANAVIVVDARDGIPELTFRVKAMLRDSYTNMTLVLATESEIDG